MPERKKEKERKRERVVPSVRAARASRANFPSSLKLNKAYRILIQRRYYRKETVRDRYPVIFVISLIRLVERERVGFALEKREFLQDIAHLSSFGSASLSLSLSLSLCFLILFSHSLRRFALSSSYVCYTRES